MSAHNWPLHGRRVFWLSHIMRCTCAGSALADLVIRLPSMGPFVVGAVSSWDCDAVVDEATVSGMSAQGMISHV